MISALKEIATEVSNNIRKKLNIRAIVKNSQHFQERLLQRFEDEDYQKIEKALIKAFEKASPNGKTFKYTHPAYNVTVVVKKLGVNCIELVTCWKNPEEAEYA